MGCRTSKGEFLGEKAVFFIDQNNQKFCSAVQINDFILTGSIFNYSALPSGKTPIHSSTCVLTSSLIIIFIVGVPVVEIIPLAQLSRKKVWFILKKLKKSSDRYSAPSETFM